MTPDMTQLVVWLNAVANACASVLLAPIAMLPGWLSATLVAAVMGVPMCLLLGQLALWYQARPLRVDEDAVVTLKLAEKSNAMLPAAQLAANSEVAITVGPVRVPSKHMVCWNVRVRQPGYHRLTF